MTSAVAVGDRQRPAHLRQWFATVLAAGDDVGGRYAIRAVSAVVAGTFLLIENLEQVEAIRPVKISTPSAGMYDAPERTTSCRRWCAKLLPHSRQFGNFDLVLGGNAQRRCWS